MQVALQNFAILVLLQFFVFNAQRAEARSCRPRLVSGAEGVSVLAHDKHSPFAAMTTTSLFGNLLASVTLANGIPEHEDTTSLNSVVAYSWLVIAYFSASQMCPPVIDPSVDGDRVSIEDLDRSRLQASRRTFFLVHTLATLTTFAYYLESEERLRNPIMLGAIALPAFTDIVLRQTLTREKVSPWSFSTTLVQRDDRDIRLAPGLLVHYEW
jgi:hypothetical protein